MHDYDVYVLMSICYSHCVKIDASFLKCVKMRQICVLSRVKDENFSFEIIKVHVGFSMKDIHIRNKVLL